MLHSLQSNTFVASQTSQDKQLRKHLFRHISKQLGYQSFQGLLEWNGFRIFFSGGYLMYLVNLTFRPIFYLSDIFTFKLQNNIVIIFYGSCLILDDPLSNDRSPSVLGQSVGCVERKTNMIVFSYSYMSCTHY